MEMTEILAIIFGSVIGYFVVSQFFFKKTPQNNSHQEVPKKATETKDPFAPFDPFGDSGKNDSDDFNKRS